MKKTDEIIVFCKLQLSLSKKNHLNIYKTKTTNNCKRDIKFVIQIYNNDLKITLTNIGLRTVRWKHVKTRLMDLISFEIDKCILHFKLGKNDY